MGVERRVCWMLLARYIYLITRPDYFNEQTIECENLYPADVGLQK